MKEYDWAQDKLEELDPTKPKEIDVMENMKNLNRQQRRAAERIERKYLNQIKRLEAKIK